MNRREFLKSGIAAALLLLVKPWKLIQKVVPQTVLHAQAREGLYPGKVKILNREVILQSSPFAG